MVRILVEGKSLLGESLLYFIMFRLFLFIGIDRGICFIGLGIEDRMRNIWVDWVVGEGDVVLVLMVWGFFYGVRYDR